MRKVSAKSAQPSQPAPPLPPLPPLLDGVNVTSVCVPLERLAEYMKLLEQRGYTTDRTASGWEDDQKVKHTGPNGLPNLRLVVRRDAIAGPEI